MSEAAVVSEKPDIDRLRQWIGRTEEASDVVTAQLVKGLRSTLFQEIGEPKVGDAAPFCTHWCLAPPVYPMSQLSQDGHPTRGGFLPPVPLPRRMWAGGELEFIDPLRVGDEVKRSSRISDVNLKTGSTGTLCFVAVQHEITTPRGIAIGERHDIVYREATTGPQVAPKAPPAPPPAKHRESHVSDPVLLFRYSALTFNGHRIHYDRDYVTKVEGYPGLVFHGPLQASFIVEFAAKLHGGQAPKKLVYRGLQPLFEGSEFSINANDNGSGGLEIWTANAEGQPTMKGVATW
jgi:3-methylfumaryl-CoA hydratase